MRNGNPERRFVTDDISAYEGMKVEEYTFCQLENYNGDLQDYAFDLITLPKESEESRPVVIFIHGGGFVQPNDKRQGYIPVFAKELTKAGYAVISPDYPVFDNRRQRNAWNRSSGADRAAEAIHLAYMYIKENAERLRLDTDRIAVMGGSAGGMTGFYWLEHYKDKVLAFINCWGAPRGIIPNVTNFPPTLSVHGTADTTVPYELELPIQNALEKSDIPHKLITLDGAGHTPMRFFQTYIRSVIEWLDKYMSKPSV